MRAKEFVIEAKAQGDVPDSLKGTTNGMVRMRDVGGYDRFYHMNRMGMVLAMADGSNSKAIPGVDAASFSEKFNIAFPYTDLEHMMMFQAMATIPTDSKELVKRSKSKEAPDTNVQSPVSNWNKKK
jgi:hypothetical protein